MEQRKRLDNSDTQAVSGIVSSAIKACIEARAVTSQDITSICISAAASGVTTMAQLLGKDHKLTTESVLYASLLLSRAIQPETVTDENYDSGFAGCQMQNNPVMASEAMNDVRKLTGKEPAEYLHGPFINAVAEGLKAPRIVQRLSGPSRYVN